MNQSYLGVAEIYQKDTSTLIIHWTDQKVQEFNGRDLRLKCPCASCRDEFTGKRIVKNEDIPSSCLPTKLQSIGRYAMNISFNDGHSTGIYSFSYLRSLFTIDSKL